jgi:exonuclease III
MASVNKQLSIFSFNMHGFNQGVATVVDLITSSVSLPDIFLLQEHWLTPANLNKFSESFPDYICFGSSALSSSVESGILRGRPFGGVMALVNNKLCSITETLFRADRCTVVKVADLIIINFYLPCSGTVDRQIVCQDTLAEAWAVREQYPDCRCVIGGDLNTNLDESGPISKLLVDFFTVQNLKRCDVIFPSRTEYTYYNESLNHSSTIDYILISDSVVLVDFDIIDHEANLSDHLPIMCICNYTVNTEELTDCDKKKDSERKSNNFIVKQLRWDHADLLLYYEATRLRLQPILSDIINLETNSGCLPANFKNAFVDRTYLQVIDVLTVCADKFVPVHNKHFYKFWWNQELDQLKDNSIVSAKQWKAAGRPRSGHIFQQYKTNKLAYKQRIRTEQQREPLSYSNDLHEALCQKSGTAFWKCWKSKFETAPRTNKQVNGLSDEVIIANKFAHHFAEACTTFDTGQENTLKHRYTSMKARYDGLPLTDDYYFDAELVERVSGKLKRGKAAGLDSLMAEHVQYSHPLVIVILSKLFNMFMDLGHVPPGFGQSYTVPLPKSDDSRGQPRSVEDFRGISISPIMSKIFEHCILDRFQAFF